MSMRIPCPHCGTRTLEEWVYGEVFEVPANVEGAAQRDIDRGFMHNNVEGTVHEAWFHLYGCRRWVKVTRDTITDQIIETA